jgi:hypothetical protein
MGPKYAINVRLNKRISEKAISFRNYVGLIAILTEDNVFMPGPSYRMIKITNLRTELS